jgi:hypothetical protein
MASDTKARVSEDGGELSLVLPRFRHGQLVRQARHEIARVPKRLCRAGDRRRHDHQVQRVSEAADARVRDSPPRVRETCHFRAETRELRHDCRGTFGVCRAACHVFAWRRRAHRTRKGVRRRFSATDDYDRQGRDAEAVHREYIHSRKARIAHSDGFVQVASIT